MTNLSAATYNDGNGIITIGPNDEDRFGTCIKTHIDLMDALD